MSVAKRFRVFTGGKLARFLSPVGLCEREEEREREREREGERDRERERERDGK